MKEGEAKAKKTVRVFAAASFLNDLGSDIIYPIWPLFVTEILRANMAVLGFLDGLGRPWSLFPRLLPDTSPTESSAARYSSGQGTCAARSRGSAMPYPACGRISSPSASSTASERSGARLAMP